MGQSMRREKWIVLAACQALGLARAIEAVAKSIDCDACDAWQIKGFLAQDPDYFRSYDFALVLPELHDPQILSAENLPSYIDVPAFMFGAYHPDCCYTFANGASVTDGPIGPYHSMIALAAYKEELAASEAVKFYALSVYEQAGYHLHWEPHRNHMIATFAKSGLDIAPMFKKLSRGGSFMHATDHPTIEVLVEIARATLKKLDRPTHDVVPPIVDNLAVMNWPIYPEIGELLGVRGAYQFRVANTYRTVDLETYLQSAFDTFGRWHKSELRVIPEIQRRLRHIRRIIREGL